MSVFVIVLVVAPHSSLYLVLERIRLRLGVYIWFAIILFYMYSICLGLCNIIEFVVHNSSLLGTSVIG